jgi:hypothetical protein
MPSITHNEPFFFFLPPSRGAHPPVALALSNGDAAGGLGFRRRHPSPAAHPTSPAPPNLLRPHPHPLLSGPAQSTSPHPGLGGTCPTSTRAPLTGGHAPSARRSWCSTTGQAPRGGHAPSARRSWCSTTGQAPRGRPRPVRTSLLVKPGRREHVAPTTGLPGAPPVVPARRSSLLLPPHRSTTPVTRSARQVLKSPLCPCCYVIDASVMFKINI